jgi:hypothetical protein
MEKLDVPQMRVSRHDIVGPFLNGTGQKFIIGGVILNPIGPVQIL